MAINSIIFWFAFIAVLLPYFTVLRHSAKAQNVWLLAASYAIYGYADWRMLPLLLAVTVFYYFLAPAIARNRQTNARRANTLSTVGIVVGVGVLWWFKYLNFCIEQFTELFNSAGIGASTSTMKIIMPVGISFFTFKLISYTIEVRRGNIQPERNFINFGTYVAFFPTIMSGPIDRPKPFLDQLRHNHLANSTDLSEGAKRVLWGFFLKMCIANRICIYTDSVFNHCFFHNGTTLIVASVLYLIQMYTDFSGYSHMAVGVSRMMGIRVMENFQQPFFAQNVADFWRRWHITLSTWFKEYLYIPLGGNRRGLARQALNLLIVWTLTGFWHGAGWNFVMWGLYYFAILFIEKLFLLKALDKLPRLFRHAYALLLIVIGWVIFASDDVSVMLPYLGSMFGANGALGGMDVYTLLTRAALMVICCVASTELPRRLFVTAAGKMNEKAAFTVKSVLTLTLLALSVVFLIGDSYNPFLYFRF